MGNPLLQNNGGFTETIALVAGSPAIDAGDNTLVNESTHQRGTGFDRIVNTPDANFNGSDSFTYTITDSNGDTSTATVNVTVNAVNDMPVINEQTFNATSIPLSSGEVFAEPVANTIFHNSWEMRSPPKPWSTFNDDGDGNDLFSIDDLLFGGFSDDILNGGAGIDRLYGQNDDDIINGGDGNDLLFAGFGDDILDGGDGDDRLSTWTHFFGAGIARRSNTECDSTSHTT